ncbi:MAG: NUDIX domain-containing protein [Pseudomonadota bacterium]
MNTSLTELPSDAEPDWTLIVDGTPMRCRMARLESVFGAWSYGWHPGGYDTWWFAEHAGGGAIVLPYVKVEGRLLVGLIAEQRPNAGSKVWGAIGGFVDGDESHLRAAQREALEEVGLASETVHALPGTPALSNRAFFVADLPAGKGVHFFAVAVPQAQVELVSERDTTGRKMHDDLLAPSPSSPKVSGRWWTPPGAEIEQILFLDWEDAVVASADALALAGLARLKAWTERSG